MNVRMVPTKAQGVVTAVPGALRLRRPSRWDRARRAASDALPGDVSPRVAVPLVAGAVLGAAAVVGGLLRRRGGEG